ncbi:MAG: O-methyltransferase involved in polyketide biosynthesis, partial [Gammaproteobacteria bacterium]
MINSGLDLNKSTLSVFEGLSMYFEKEHFLKIISVILTKTKTKTKTKT